MSDVVRQNRLTLSTEEIDELITQLLNIGEAMYYSGSEISRIEDSLRRLGKAYGAKGINIYAITSSIVITLEFEGRETMTQSRRIGRDSTDMAKLEHLNSLCRTYSASPRPVEALKTDVERILREVPNPRLALVGSVLAASFLAVFFGGGAADFVAAGLVAILIWLMQRYVKPLCSGQFFYNVLTSFATGAVVCMAAKWIPILNQDKIMIGDIMVLIPGIAITNSIRYTISGDSISGVEKLIDSLLQAMGIAVGFTLAIYLFG